VPTTGYAPVNGLRMYFEVHGPEGEPAGGPVLLLHGAYMTAGDLAPLVSALAATRQVVVPDLQAHGRTADVDRPITYEGLADDAAGLLAHLGIESADVLGYSMGGAAALQVAVRHPEVVRTLVVVSATHSSDGMQPELQAMISGITPEVFAGSPMEDADAVLAEHAVELFRLLGGGAMGDLSGLPRARLAILPGTTHFMPVGSGVLDRLDWLLPMVLALLDTPPETPPG
jgi:pimeloyl-ACP methyl ester carboxylesterase